MRKNCHLNLHGERVSYCVQGPPCYRTISENHIHFCYTLPFSSDALFWTSLNDIKSEGTYIWESTQKNLYPWGGGIGYANWAPTQPDNNNVVGENCILINWGNQKAWDDFTCSSLLDAICESQP